MMTIAFLVAIAVILLRMEWTPACDKVHKSGWASDPPKYAEAQPKTAPCTSPNAGKQPGSAGPYTKNQVSRYLTSGARIRGRTA